MACQTTLLELVNAISHIAANEAETIATVVHLVNSGQVRLCGSFAGQRFEDVSLLLDSPARAA